MATTEAERLITKPKPVEPVEYIHLEEIGDGLNEFYVTVEGDTATIWIYEGYGDPPEAEREFNIPEFEEIVAWLGRKESKEEDVDKILGSVGRFMWEDGAVRLYLHCGDERHFELKDLRLLALALRKMKPSTEPPDPRLP